MYEVAHEVVQFALVLRVDIHLRENFVDCFDCVDSVWIGTRHAFHFLAALVVLNVDRKDCVQLIVTESILQSSDVGLCLISFVSFVAFCVVFLPQFHLMDLLKLLCLHFRDSPLLNGKVGWQGMTASIFRLLTSL